MVGGQAGMAGSSDIGSDCEASEAPDPQQCQRSHARRVAGEQPAKQRQLHCHASIDYMSATSKYQPGPESWDDLCQWPFDILKRMFDSARLGLEETT